MRALPFVVLAACGGSGHPALPDGSSPPDVAIAIPADAIVIHTELPPIVVAFRAGTTGPWQAATPLTATTFEAKPHGPFVVAVQCADAEGDLYQTIELARTLDDPHEIDIACDLAGAPAQPFAVTGRLVQPGQVWFATGDDTSSTGNWTYSFSAATGTYDLVAVSATAIAVRRGLDVHGDTGVAPEIDLTHEGAPLVPAALAVTNASQAESVLAVVDFDDAALHAQLYYGAPAAAMVAPDAVLLPTDRQTASVIANDGIHWRSLRRGFTPTTARPSRCRRPAISRSRSSRGRRWRAGHRCSPTSTRSASRSRARDRRGSRSSTSR